VDVTSTSAMAIPPCRLICISALRVAGCPLGRPAPTTRPCRSEACLHPLAGGSACPREPLPNVETPVPRDASAPHAPRGRERTTRLEYPSTSRTALRRVRCPHPPSQDPADSSPAAP
jgi:hypothetical protein